VNFCRAGKSSHHYLGWQEQRDITSVKRARHA
jgi:hypothetical protein